MRKLLLVAGLAVAALVPSLASAQSCEQQRDNQTASTFAGAGLGAVVGSVLAPHDRGAGAVVGAVGGGVLANQASKPDRDCSHAYGYYDHSGQWHVNNIDRSRADGYYDRDGGWVQGAPNGRYDANGRWVQGEAGGRYDNDGRWVDDPAGGGRYDANGHWVAAYGYSSDTSGFDHNATQHRDVDTREAWLQQRIQSASNDGSLSPRDARHAMRDLNAIRAQEADFRQSGGRISMREEAQLQSSLDRLSNSLRASLADNG